MAAWTVWPGLSVADRRYLPALAAIGLTLLMAGLAGLWVPGVGWGIGLLGAAFMVRLSLDPTATIWTPLAGVWLLLIAELSYWSFELDSVIGMVGSRAPAKLIQLGLTLLGTAVAILLVSAVVPYLPELGPWRPAGGAVALALFIGILSWLAGRGDRPSSPARPKGAST